MLKKSSRLFALVDQVFSSVTNYVVALCAAHFLGIRGLANISAMFAIYGVALALARAIAGDVLMFRASRTTGGMGDAAAAQASGRLSLIGGSASALGLGLASVFVAGSMRSCLFVLALALPGLLYQDSLRYVAIAQEVPALAALNDGVWLACQGVGYGFELAFFRPTLLSLVGIWCSAGLIAALVGRMTLSANLRHTEKRVCRRYLVVNRALIGSLVVEYGFIAAVAQAIPLVVAWASTVRATADYRAVLVVFGPLNVLSLGLSLLSVPRSAKLLGAGEPLHRVTRPLILVLLVLSAAGGIYTSILLSGVFSLGRFLTGDAWFGARPLLVLGLILLSLNNGAFVPATVLRLVGRNFLSVAFRLVAAPLTILLAFLLADSMGAQGAFIGQIFGASALALFLGGAAWRCGQSRRDRRIVEARLAILRSLAVGEDAS